MDTGNLKRRLMAILAADAVSYSRMMEQDEERTLRVLTGHRELIDPLIAGYGGHIIGTAGDSVLAEFGSAVDAVRCAIEMQDAVRERNEGLQEHDRMWFRVGVNLGDVIVSESDVHGDGINVAARLESIAPPGGVCISSSVYDQISGKLNLGFADMGEQNLKNISRPVRAYRFAGPLPILEPSRPRSASRRRGWAWGAAALLAVAALIAAWQGGYLSLVLDRVAAGTAESSEPRRGNADESARLQDERVLAKARTGSERESRETVAAARAASELQQALEAQRIAEMKAQAEAELARARVKADAITRAAEAEARAMQEATTPATVEPSRAAVKPEMTEDAQSLRRFDGAWVAWQRCDAWKKRPAVGFRVPAKILDGTVHVERGVPGEHGYVSMVGRLTNDGEISLEGRLIPRREDYGRQERPVRYQGRFDDGLFALDGQVGYRPCTLLISRSTQ